MYILIASLSEQPIASIASVTVIFLATMSLISTLTRQQCILSSSCVVASGLFRKTPMFFSPFVITILVFSIHSPVFQLRIVPELFSFHLIALSKENKRSLSFLVRLLIAFFSASVMFSPPILRFNYSIKNANCQRIYSIFNAINTHKNNLLFLYNVHKLCYFF